MVEKFRIWSKISFFEKVSISSKFLVFGLKFSNWSKNLVFCRTFVFCGNDYEWAPVFHRTYVQKAALLPYILKSNILWPQPHDRFGVALITSVEHVQSTTRIRVKKLSVE